MGFVVEGVSASAGRADVSCSDAGTLNDDEQAAYEFAITHWSGNADVRL